MVYTNGVHLIADSVDELHRFAHKILLSKCWFHNPKGKNKPHYDMINAHIVDRAINAGAIYISSKAIVNLLRKNLVK